MPPRRQVPTRGTPTPPEEPEQSGSAELRELRALVTHLVARSYRQDQYLEQLLAQRGDVTTAEGVRAPEQSSARKRPISEVEGQAGGWGPPRPQSQGSDRSNRRRPGRSERLHFQQQRRSQQGIRCIFCGGPHPPGTCDQRWGRCYRCGQPGHFRASCPLRTSVAPPPTSTPRTRQQGPGVLPTCHLTERATLPHPVDRRQPSSSIRDYAAQVEDSSAADLMVAGIISLLALEFERYLIPVHRIHLLVEHLHHYMG